MYCSRGLCHQCYTYEDGCTKPNLTPCVKWSTCTWCCTVQSYIHIHNASWWKAKQTSNVENGPHCFLKTAGIGLEVDQRHLNQWDLSHSAWCCQQERLKKDTSSETVYKEQCARSKKKWRAGVERRSAKNKMDWRTWVNRRSAWSKEDRRRTWVERQSVRNKMGWRTRVNRRSAWSKKDQRRTWVERQSARNKMDWRTWVNRRSAWSKKDRRRTWVARWSARNKKGWRRHELGDGL